MKKGASKKRKPSKRSKTIAKPRGKSKAKKKPAKKQTKTKLKPASKKATREQSVLGGILSFLGIHNIKHRKRSKEAKLKRIMHRMKKEDDSVKRQILKNMSKRDSKPNIASLERKKTLLEEVMTSNPITINENSTIEEALDLMVRYTIRSVPVIRNGNLVGVIEEMDLLNHFKLTGPRKENLKTLGKEKIKKIIKSNLITSKPGDSLNVGIKKLEKVNANRIFIVKNKKLIGVVTKGDIVRTIVKKATLREPLGNIFVKTGIDRLLELIERKGRVSANDASRVLKEDKETIEEWSMVLQTHDLIKIEYPIVGTMELIKK